MKFFWICLHETFLKRKTAGGYPTDIEIEFIDNSSVKEKAAMSVVVEGKKLTSDLIDIAIENNAAIFIENYRINALSIQNIKLLAIKGIPFFWKVDDVFNYLRFLRKIFDKTAKYPNILSELFKLENSYHSVKVSELSFRMAKKLNCPDDILHSIRSAALFHDIGKLLMPRSFINAVKWYTPIEKEYIRFHTFYGLSLLNKYLTSDSQSYQIMKDVILNHHERIDGSGYPFGLRGDEIPLSAKIVAVADVYDALRTNRPYRSACDHDLAITYLKGKNGIFDKKIVEILEEVVFKNSDIWKSTNTDCKKIKMIS